MIIGAKDVIHDVGLAHFRMKMDAVPGIPTTMWFTPTKTTKQMKEETKRQIRIRNFLRPDVQADHTGMRGTIIVETQEEFDAWMAGKKPQYATVLEAGKPAVPKDTATAAKPSGSCNEQIIKNV